MVSLAGEETERGEDLQDLLLHQSVVRVQSYKKQTRNRVFP